MRQKGTKQWILHLSQTMVTYRESVIATLVASCGTTEVESIVCQTIGTVVVWYYTGSIPTYSKPNSKNYRNKKQVVLLYTDTHGPNNKKSAVNTVRIVGGI